MSDTGAKYAGSVSEGDGYNSWTNLNNVLANDSAYATNSQPPDTPKITLAKLIKGGSQSGDNKASNTSIPTSVGNVDFGGASDLWGNTLSDSDINASNFGIAVQITWDLAGTIKTFLLTNYGFSVPSGATINGIAAAVRCYYAGSRYSKTAYVDCVGLTVYYTEGGGTAFTQTRMMTGWGA